jgi:hypothetical protein
LWCPGTGHHNQSDVILVRFQAYQCHIGPARAGGMGVGPGRARG